MHKVIDSKIFLGILLLATFFEMGCNTTQFLKDDEAYLTKNEIVFENKNGGKVKNKSNLKYELETIYKQRPNKKLLGVPRQYFHFVSMDTVGRNKIGRAYLNFLQKKPGEEPIFFNELLAEETSRSMTFYLQHKGYFLAETGYYPSYKDKNRKVEVTYYVSPNGQYLIDTVYYQSRDSQIQQILNEISPESFLVGDQPVDVRLYDQEVARINSYMRNNGYAFFLPHYVSDLRVIDSTDFSMKLNMEVLLREDGSFHEQFRVGDIYVYPEFNGANSNSTIPDTTINDVYFATMGQRFRVKPRILLNSVFIKKGELFNQENIESSLRQLSSLGIFRFWDIKYTKNPEKPGILDFHIYLTPNKKWEIGADFDVNNTGRKGVVGNRNLAGFSISPSVRSRNLFRGAELWVSNVDLGIEIAPFADTIINTLDFKVQSDLYFPRFVDYFGLWKGLNKINLVSDKYYGYLKRRATSKFSSSYNLLSLVNYYKYNFANISFGYDFQRSPQSRFIVNNAGFDLLIPDTKPAFDTILVNNPFLANSFTSQLITGFILRDFTYIYTGRPNRSGNSWYFQGTLDLAGLEVFGANSLWNAVSKTDSIFNLKGAEFSQYIRLDLDGRRNWRLSPKRTFVARLSAGIVIPYGNSQNAPYVKQFFVGGPQSIRGWSARGLGPGLYVDPITLDNKKRNLFYQTGDFKLEFNLEYRFHLLRFVGLFDVKGAFFVDGGNIWSLGFNEEERQGALLKWKREFNEDGEIINDNFFKEMGVSAGFGTRWDFTYVTVRLDLGTPIKNNFPDPTRNNSYWVDFSNWSFGEVIFNLGLGYPF